MIVFWILAAVLTLAVGAALVWPLWETPAQADSSVNPDIPIYRNQLDELQRDLAAGAIGEAEARAAKAEISRRILAAGGEEQVSTTTLSTRQRRGVAVLALAIVPMLATVIYLNNGEPGYASQPYTDQNGEAELWMQYAQAYMQVERFQDARDAYLEALALSDPRADLFEKFGEATLLADGGEFSVEAIKSFRNALELDPTRERSAYLLAEWQYRSGDREGGARAFVDLLENTQDENVQEFLKKRINDAIAEMRAELAGDPAAVRPELPEQQEDPGPLSGFSPEQRVQINQMVENLAARLEGDPGDLEGWLRIIRAYSVLQEADKAQAAVKSATFAFLTEPEALEKILDLANELELTKGPELPEGAQGLTNP